MKRTSAEKKTKIKSLIQLFSGRCNLPLVKEWYSQTYPRKHLNMVKEFRMVELTVAWEER